MTMTRSTPSTVWTWLTRPRGRHRARTARAQRRRQRGVALVAVMIAIAITLVMTNQFGTSTNVDLIAAGNYRDHMRAHFLARSAQNLTELMIRVQQRLDNNKQTRGRQITGPVASMVMSAFCGEADEIRSTIGFSPSDVKGLGADIGTCGLVGEIGTDDDKINVNCANGTAATALTLKSALDALVFFNAYDPVFEEPDAEGYRRDRATQVAAIVDYIDSDGMRNRERGTTEDYGYESLRDPYRAKNNYIDTLGELKLVRGVDDRFWTLFGSAFTVYGGCKTNLSAVSNPQLIAALLYLAAKNPNDPMLMYPQKLYALAGLIAKAKQFGQQFSTLDEFISYAKNPVDVLGSLAGTMGAQGSAASAALNSGAVSAMSGGQQLGLELDRAKLAQIAVAGPRRTYRVQAWGEITRKQKNADGSYVYPPIRATITGVFDTKVVTQNVRKPPVPRGTWVFLRED